MAEAAIEERQLLKSLRWYDGFVIALCNPGFLIGSLGFSVGALGGWGAMTLWGISATIGLLSNWIYSETAAMFPNQSGGIALYAHEGWRKYFSLVGPIATFGYWIGWSVVLSIFGKIIGDLVEAKWFPGQASHVYFSIGSNHLGLPHMIAIGVIVAVWAFNVMGVKPTLWVGYVTGALLMLPLIVFIVVPFTTGDFHSSNMTWTVNGPWGGLKVAFVWLFLMAWSAYGIEVCASFAPEYHDTKRDTALALRSAATFSLLVYVLLPLGVTGASGVDFINKQGAEGQFYVGVFDKLVGSGLSGVMLVFLLASLLLSMNSSTADGGRALYGISKAGMTIKELGVLNRFHVPARAMTVDLIVNVGLVLFVSSNLAILYLSNIGYVFAHVAAMSGFLLLRRDRPDWPRPIKVARGWLPVAAVIAASNAVFLVVGAGNPKLNGYGTWSDFGIGIGVLCLSVVLYAFRRTVQDHQPIHLREETPKLPGEEVAPPAVGVPVT
ncbi:MAG: APC family permease [Thermoleophilia bacterium]|nr:APC family permease [Thermoleophilia bacterium]